MIYGIRSIPAPDPTNTDEMVKVMDQILVARGYVKVKDHVVFMAGQPIGRPGTTNFVKLHRIGETW
jgi:pyruvate kinase